MTNLKFKGWALILTLVLWWVVNAGAATSVGLNKGLRFQDGASTTNVSGIEYVPTKTGRVTLGGANNQDLLAAGIVSSNLTAGAVVKVAGSGPKALTNAVDGVDFYGPGSVVPIAKGGTGQTTAAGAMDALSETAEGTIAAAPTTDLSTVAAQNVVITGTSGSITNLGTMPAGAWKRVRFQSTGVSLIYNVNAIDIPAGGASMGAAAGDRFHAVSQGGGKWFLYNYTKGDGTATVGAANIAPADAHYLTTQAEGNLTQESNLGGLTTGLLKITVSAGVATPSTATSATDYAPATSGSAILKGNGAGGFGNATQGVDYFGPATKTDVLQAADFAADGGANDTYTCTYSPAITAYVTGARYRFKANTANTGTATININSVGAKTIKKVTSGITTDLSDNDIRAGQWVEVVYDGTNMQMVSVLGNASAGGASGDVVGPGSATDNALARYDTTTGKLIQDSLVTADDSGNVSTPGTLATGAGGALPGGISFSGGDITLTNSATNFFAMLGATAGISMDGAVLPNTDDGYALGSTTKEWSDLFLASGAVINFANGNYTLTHSSGKITGSGDFSIGTSAVFTAGTIELGHATANTLSAASGVLSIEGQAVFAANTKNDVLQAATFASDAGANDTYTCSFSPAITAYVTGTRYRFLANTANTGAATININSLGAKTIKKAAGGITTDLADNDIRAGQWVEMVYDGTNMQMVSLLGNAPAGSGTVTATGGSLTANSVLLGAGTTDTKVVAGIVSDGVSKITLGVAGTSVGSLAFNNATSGQLTVNPPTGAMGTITVTWPNASSTLPIFGQQITFAGPTAARTVTLPDAAFTVARTDAANTFTGVQTLSSSPVLSSGAVTVSGSTITFPTTADTLVGRATTDTLTNKRITARITSISSSATPTVNTDNADCVTITALAAAITSMTTNLSGTPNNFDQLEFRIKDDGTARAITWGASFVAGPTALPTTTVISKALHVYFEYDSVQAKWVCMSSGSDA